MKIEITARGIYGADGKEVPVGTVAVVNKEPTGWRGRYRVISDDETGKAAITNPASGDPPATGFVPPVGPFEARERSAGWWAIYDGKGEVVGKSVRKNDLEGFDGLSDEDKQEFATAHAKAAFDAENKG